MASSKVSFIDDAYERQPGRTAGVHVHTYCTNNNSSVGSEIRIGSWNVSVFCMHTRVNSCIGRLNAEGDRDSAS